MQWGQKKGKSDLRTYWDRYFHQSIVARSGVIMGLVSLSCERRPGCLGLSKMKEKRDYNDCLYEGVNTVQTKKTNVGTRTKWYTVTMMQLRSSFLIIRTIMFKMSVPLWAMGQRNLTTFKIKLDPFAKRNVTWVSGVVGTDLNTTGDSFLSPVPVCLYK